MGQDNNMNDQGRRPEQQQNNPSQQQPNQQNQQRDPQNQNQGQSGQRIDTDGDGRTRDPNDTRPTDDGGRGEPVQR
ncbi:MAG: hypothetical protein JNL41_11395 [Phenylobacterium sp.]|uniref:hypothetical protein n=1 Tax=Phenylobacterium sp. TaxID=1871053 RepID=UPI001A3DEDDA|nr:hypothetical protein [Phenylobacterium sp.]MBL8554873.1 hypothetical protein [Phenylobacterium sp.]